MDQLGAAGAFAHVLAHTALTFTPGHSLEHDQCAKQTGKVTKRDLAGTCHTTASAAPWAQGMLLTTTAPYD